MKKISITLPEDMVEELDKLSEEADTDRSDVIESFLEHCLGNEEIIETVFPLEEEGEPEEEEES